MPPCLINLHFDKGNGALFSISHQGQLVNCWVSQDNAFLSKKTSPGQNFPDVFERYEVLIAEAAELSITAQGVSSDIWGNEISAQDIEAAQQARRTRAARSA